MDISKKDKDGSIHLQKFAKIPNQWKNEELSKKWQKIKLIRDQLILRTDSEIVIFGGWYGSILIPAFKEVKRITLIDKDKDVISIAIIFK